MTDGVDDGVTDAEGKKKHKRATEYKGPAPAWMQENPIRAEELMDEITYMSCTKEAAKKLEEQLKAFIQHFCMYSSNYSAVFVTILKKQTAGMTKVTQQWCEKLRESKNAKLWKKSGLFTLIKYSFSTS